MRSPPPSQVCGVPEAGPHLLLLLLVKARSVGTDVVVAVVRGRRCRRGRWGSGGGIPQAGATPRTERSSGSCVPRRRSSGSIVPRRRSGGPAATPPPPRRTETPAVDGWVVVCTDAAQHSGPQQHRCVSRARVPSRTDATTRGVLCGYSGTRVGRSYSHEEEGAMMILAPTCAAWANRIRTRARHGWARGTQGVDPGPSSDPTSSFIGSELRAEKAPGFTSPARRQCPTPQLSWPKLF